MSSMEILVMPDPHDTPDNPDKSRFSKAMELAIDRKPNHIICLGDWPTLDSLSSYDEGSVFAEGRRYSDDIASHLLSLETFHKPLDDYNIKRRLWKEKQYKPGLHYCYGNHDVRIVKAIQQEPRLIGSMKMDDLGFTERGWNTYQLGKPCILGGIAFAHYFTSGIMSKPISGVHHAHSLIVKGLSSCVVGHSHLRDFAEMTDVKGNQVFGLVAGCFYDHLDHYTSEGVRNWKGLVYLKIEDKVVNHEFIGLKEIMER